MKRIAVLGSTGSIGRSTLAVIASHPERLQLVGVAARTSVDQLAEQIRTFHPALVAVWRLSGQNQVLLAAASWPTEDGD